jgi:hypothetical protein
MVNTNEFRSKGLSWIFAVIVGVLTVVVTGIMLVGSLRSPLNVFLFFLGILLIFKGIERASWCETRLLASDLELKIARVIRVQRAGSNIVIDYDPILFDGDVPNLVMEPEDLTWTAAEELLESLTTDPSRTMSIKFVINYSGFYSSSTRDLGQILEIKILSNKDEPIDTQIVSSEVVS